MIKPFKITNTRAEVGGGQMVFFTITWVEQVSDSRSRSSTMETAIHVPDGEDVDQYIYASLQKSGWI